MKDDEVGLPSDLEDIVAEQLVEDDISLPSPSEDTSAGGLDENNPSLPSDLEDNVAEQLGEDDIAEIYSPPRVVAVPNKLGLKGYMPHRPQDRHGLHAQTVPRPFFPAAGLRSRRYAS